MFVNGLSNYFIYLCSLETGTSTRLRDRIGSLTDNCYARAPTPECLHVKTHQPCTETQYSAVCVFFP